MDIYIIVNFLLSLALSLCQEDSQDHYYQQYPSSIPVFLPVPTNITVHEGETAHLRCRIHNLGPKMVVWRKTNEDFPLTVGKRAFTPNRNIDVETEDISETETRYDLIIKNVNEEQSGIYECQISAINTYTMNISLHVLDPVDHKPELSLFGTKYVSLMENVHLICNATGSTKAPDGVDWFFNGDVITERNPQWYGRLVKINRKPLPGRSLISEIIIEKATMTDRGHYVCRFTKQLAEGFKVHVLNDLKNHKEPKRDMDESESYEHADTLSSTDNGASSFNSFRATYIIASCYWLAVLAQQ